MGKFCWSNFHVTKASVVVFSISLFLMAGILFLHFTTWQLVFSPQPSLGHHVFICNYETPKTMERGDKISFDFPYNTFFYKKDDPFIKIIGCLPGDKLTVDKGKNYFCNGEWLGKARDTSSDGKGVSNFEFSGEVPANKIFVYGTHPKSYDSRYWGFLDVAAVDGKCYGP